MFHPIIDSEADRLYETERDANLPKPRAPRFPTYPLKPFNDKITRRNFVRLEFKKGSMGEDYVKVYFKHDGAETFANIYEPYYVLRFKLWHDSQKEVEF